jgi:hypothetical protein
MMRAWRVGDRRGDRAGMEEESSMTGATRPSQTARILIGFIVLAMVLTGILTVWHPGAGAQDGTGFSGTAVVEFTPTAYVEPTPTPTAPPVTYDEPEFMDGPFRIVVQRAAWESEIEELELSARSGRTWLAVVVDVINFSDVATSVTPGQFAIRLAGGERGGIAKSTTEQTAELLGLGPDNIDAEELLQPGESERYLLVFQFDAGYRDPALAYQRNAIPLQTRIDQQLGFDDLPAVAAAPELTPAVVSNVIDGNTLQLVGDANGEIDLAGVDAPVGDDCYAEESTSYMASITNQQVLVEEPGNGQEGVYLWFPLQNGSGFRVLVNQDAIISGNAGSSAEPGGRFTAWMDDSSFVARLRSDGLWGRCTGPHGANRPDTLEQITFETAFNGEETEPYVPWVDWSPLILPLPNAGAIAFFSAEREPENPGTPTPSDQLERPLFYTVYDPGEGDWSVAEPLPDGGRLQFGVSGVVDSQGRVHIVYSDRRADTPAATSTLKYMVREVNGSWSRPENVAPSSLAGHQLSPSLGIDADDTLYVVWQDQRRFEEDERAASPAYADVFFARKPAGEDWTTAVDVNEHTDGEFINRPLLAVDGDRVVVVWSVYLASNLQSANRVDWSYLEAGDDAAWAEPVTMIAGRGEAFGGRLLDLEADPTGGVVFVFGRQSTDTFLFLRRLPAMSTEWAPDVLLTYGDRGTYPSLTMAPDGTAYVVYNIGAGENANVAGVALLPGAITPGPEVVLTGDIDGIQGRAAVTTDATGLPWVIYYSQPATEGSPNGVEAIRNFLIPRSLEELQALIDADEASDD